MASPRNGVRFGGGGYPFGLPIGRKPLVYRDVIGFGEKSSGVVEHEHSGSFP